MNPATTARLHALHPELTAIRRDIHAHPEMGMEEVRTSALVAETLRGWGLEVTEGIGKYGVVATLKGRRPGQRVIGLRADMDALAITETTGLPHASTNPGVMHACGHDGHTTMLLGAARMLAEDPDFGGTVHFIFQPAEEGRGGAKAMLADGLFERFPVDAVYGLHNKPNRPLGTFAIRPGPLMAAGDRWVVTFRGTGGHGGSTPHLATEVTVLDMTGAYSVFANGGYRAKPYAFTQIVNSEGQVVFDRKRDPAPSEQILDEKTVGMMNYMLSQVPERGTGRAAKLQGIKTAGKTGTTNAYRDAWFMGFTGNYVGGIWFGNDDFTSTNNMTGGSLPAQTWNRVMTFAHSGIDLKPIPYLEGGPSDGERAAPAIAANDESGGRQPQLLSTQTTSQLVDLGKLFESVPPVKPLKPVSMRGAARPGLADLGRPTGVLRTVSLSD